MTEGRRELSFNSLDEVMPDVERLLEGHSTVGHWSLAREALIKFRAPVWGGQITNRADLLMALGHGEGAREYYAEGRAAAEIARLWSAIERSVKAIRGSASASGAMHKQAA